MGRKAKSPRIVRSRKKRMTALKGKFREMKKKKFVRKIKPRKIFKKTPKKVRKSGNLKKLREKAKEWKNE